jgi:hypothetical protein
MDCFREYRCHDALTTLQVSPAMELERIKDDRPQPFLLPFDLAPRRSIHLRLDGASFAKTGDMLQAQGAGKDADDGFAK